MLSTILPEKKENQQRLPNMIKDSVIRNSRIVQKEGSRDIMKLSKIPDTVRKIELE